MMNGIFLPENILPILLGSIIFSGLLIEIKTGGLGFGLVLSLVAGGIFFWLQSSQGLVSLLPIGCFLAGLLCCFIEILTPMTGVFGLVGFSLILASFVMSFGGGALAFQSLAISFVLACALIFIVVKFLPKSRLTRPFVLKETNANYEENNSLSIGERGVAETDLRPSGMATFHEKKFDVVSQGEFLTKGSLLEIVEMDGTKILVKKVQ